MTKSRSSRTINVTNFDIHLGLMSDKKEVRTVVQRLRWKSNQSNPRANDRLAKRNEPISIHERAGKHILRLLPLLNWLLKQKVLLIGECKVHESYAPACTCLLVKPEGLTKAKPQQTSSMKFRSQTQRNHARVYNITIYTKSNVECLYWPLPESLGLRQI